MPTSHKDLDFSMLQDLLLLKIKYFGISSNKVFSKQTYKFLRHYSLVDYSPKNSDRLVLSEKGKMYLRHKRKDHLRFWIPVAISIVALFGGYDVYTNPLLEQLLQAIAKLLKTISESLGAFF